MYKSLNSPIAKIIVFLLFTSSLPAQAGFEAIPKDIAPRYHFDLARNLFATPDAERAERKRAYAALEKLEKLKGQVTASAENLLQALELSDQVQREFYRHSMYLYLSYAVNTKAELSRSEASALSAELGKRTSFVQQELLHLTDESLAQFVQQKPELKQFTFVIESARRYAPHTLSLKEEELLRELSPLARDWTAELFQRARDRTQFGSVKTANGMLDVFRQMQEVENSPDRAVREEGFRKRFAGLASQRDIYAFSLSRLIKAADQVSRLRHFKDNAEETHFAMFLTTAEVKDLYEKIASTADYNKRYERDVRDRIQKITGYKDVNLWDMSVIPPGLERPRFTIADTSRILKDSLSVLGPEYSKELAALLDPANGRLDIVGGQNRVDGAFADGLAGDPASIFYSFNFEGYFDDVDALAHEAGHAVHFQLMGNNHVRSSYAGGPSYFTESFAMFNELIVINYLYEHATDRLRKIFFLEKFLFYALYLYRNTMTAAMEQAIYDQAAGGHLMTADEMDTSTKSIGSRYSIWYDKHDELKMRWISIHHFYDNPMYYPNYVYANLLSLQFFEMFTKDPQKFIPKYVALMRNGFNATPSELLKKFLDLNLRDPQLVPDATSVLDKKLDELEALYAK